MLSEKETSEVADQPPHYEGINPNSVFNRDPYIEFFIQDLKELLEKSGAKIVDGCIVLGSLKLLIENNFVLKSKQEIILKSGCNQRSDGRKNSVHINPVLDENDTPIIKRVPFSQWRFRQPPSRPRSHRCHSGCKCRH